MLKRLLALLTVFVLSTTLYIPVTAYGQEPDENSAVVENFDETFNDEIADEISFAEETFDSDDERLQSIIARLEEANGKVPKNFTLDDMNFFLDHADEEIIDDLLGKIESNAIPVSMDKDASYRERSEQTRADTYMSYNCITGEKKELPFEVTETDPNVILESEWKNIGDILPSPYATVNAWWELNPENYYDAKAVTRIYIYGEWVFN